MHDLVGTPLEEKRTEGFFAGPTGPCATSWQTQLTDFTNRFNALNTSATNGGDLSSIKDQYVQLHDDISTTLECSAQDNDLSGTLSQSGTLQTQIKKLEKRKKELQVEVDTAVARDELLRSRDVKQTTHQLFLLDRPVRTGVIPYLWALSVVFIGIGFVFYKMYLPSLLPDTTTVVGMDVSLTSLLFNKPVFISLIVCVMVIMVVVGLKMGGIIGK